MDGNPSKKTFSAEKVKAALKRGFLIFFACEGFLTILWMLGLMSHSGSQEREQASETPEKEELLWEEEDQARTEWRELLDGWILSGEWAEGKKEEEGGGTAEARPEGDGSDEEALSDTRTLPAGEEEALSEGEVSGETPGDEEKELVEPDVEASESQEVQTQDTAILQEQSETAAQAAVASGAQSEAATQAAVTSGAQSEAITTAITAAETTERGEIAAQTEQWSDLGSAGAEKIRSGLKEAVKGLAVGAVYNTSLENAAVLRLFSSSSSMELLVAYGGSAWQQYYWKECLCYSYLIDQTEEAYQELIRSLTAGIEQNLSTGEGWSEYGIGLSIQKEEEVYRVSAALILIRQ